MIKKIFHGQINNVTFAAILISVSSLISRLLGIFRDGILAGEFGAGDTLDIYYAAFRIPDLIFNLLVLGALSAGFVPIFVSLLKNPLEKIKNVFVEQKNKEAWQLASNVLNSLVIFLFLFCGLGFIFSPWIMKLIVPGFSSEKLEMTISLSRIMFLSPFFLGISSVFGGILQSFKRFFVYSLAPIMYNIGIIIGALYIVPIIGIHGLAWGVVIGAFMHMLIQLPIVFKLGFRLNFKINFKSKNLRKIGIMMIPRTMSLAVSQINLLIITIIASTLASGSLVVFNFANNLQSFPIGIFGISFAIAVFPVLSASAFRKKELVKHFSLTIRQILFFIAPATVIFITLRAQIIRVILGRGYFNWEDTCLTIDTLGFFAISLFAQATIPLLVRMFYARYNSSLPFIIGFVTACANVFLSILLSEKLGVAGLALAFSIANIINFALLWVVLRFKIGEMDEVRILVSSVKFTISAIACGIAVQAMKFMIWPYIDMTKFLGVLIQGLVAGVFGIFVYLLFCSLLKSQEFFSFWNSIKRKIYWNKVDSGDQGEARGI